MQNVKKPIQLEAYLDTFSKVTLVIHADDIGESSFFVKDDTKVYPLLKLAEERGDGRLLLHMYVQEELPLGKDYFIVGSHGETYPLNTGAIVRTEEFDKRFAYDGADLGAVYTPEWTQFKVWAPTATNLRLKVWESPGAVKEYPMERGIRGEWHIKLPGDFHLKEYCYIVRVNHQTNEAVDPYAKAVTANGRRGVVMNLAKTDPENWKRAHRLPSISKTDSIIYEVHVRDFSIHPESGIQSKGKFLGFTEGGTTGPNGTVTGLDYLTSLGITHVELLPVNDFGSVDELGKYPNYNWGYDPVHYNAPEGSYSTDPIDPACRIKELKQLILALHERGLRVIFDVVYNHTYIREASSFEKIVPGYYFRYDRGGNPINGTGVGNDTASERAMMRKFMIDSVKYWATEYKVDGFRFDLMGIHDIETMNLIQKELSNINPSIFLLGEGWNMNTLLDENKKAKIDLAKKLPGISFFNDRFRDTVKGNVFTTSREGWIDGNPSQTIDLKECMTGNCNSLFLDPGQSINYIECHDNHTLWDRLSIIHPHEEEQIRRRRQRLGMAFVLLSQGVPFIHAGQEFFRTKFGDPNSYQSGDTVNRLDWMRKAHYENDVHFFRKLIQLRKNHAAFRIRFSEQIKKHVSFLENEQDGVIAYWIRSVQSIDSWKEIIVLFNQTLEERTVKLPGETKWIIAVEGDRINEAGLYKLDEPRITVSPLSFTIVFLPS
ncbi:type I pullulanase [Fictibacillus gelatini]|uniref:type I pullulanase n=1 Tax=Fictibacillus gelatini TaxID=225985 RepID=UPI0004102923|nr:type I pullulanase [Fictibacillus gelatini]